MACKKGGKKKGGKKGGKGGCRYYSYIIPTHIFLKHCKYYISSFSRRSEIYT